MTLECSCPAGMGSNICWHQVALLKGETRHIIGADETAVTSLAALISSTQMKGILSGYLDAENELWAATEKFNEAKARLARAMRGDYAAD